MIAGLIDTHCQLYFNRYAEDHDAVLTRALEAGVRGFIQVGNDWEGSLAAIEYVRERENMFAMAGVHPHYAKEASDSVIDRFAALYENPKVVAVGEVGLDFFRNLSPQEDQERVLLRFLDYSRTFNKPVVLHCRDAFDRLIMMMDALGGRPYRGVLHCFSGNENQMKLCLDLGLEISFAGPLTYRQNKELREACAACPVDRLLIETDAPYLPPQSKRGKRNEPAFLLEVAEVAAQIRGVSLDALIARTTQNAIRLFQLPCGVGGS